MGEGNGGQLITLWEAERMMGEMLAKYEGKVVQPRHEETQGSLDDLKRMFWGIVLLLITILGTLLGAVATKHL